LQTSAKDKHFDCKICGRGYSRQDALRRHIQDVHLKIRNHACPICSKKFQRSETLRVHIDMVHYKREFPQGSSSQPSHTMSSDIFAEIPLVWHGPIVPETQSGAGTSQIGKSSK